jgi:GT2 family glycosyltransferase
MFSIIIPNLNSPLIDQVVSALERQTARYAIHEIIVVGVDGPQRVPPTVTLIDTLRPVAAAVARNLGAQHATGDTLLFIDSDCIAALDLIERLLPHLASGRHVICGGVTIDDVSYWTRCDNLLVFAEILDSAPAGTRATIPSLNLTIRRELFLAMGGFDERFPGAAGEDLDFGLRLRRQGQALHFEPMARITHRPARATPKAIWQHLRGFGRAHAHVAQAHPDYSPIVARLRPSQAWLIMAGAVPLATVDVVRLFATTPALRCHAAAAAGMVWAKTGWYWGLAEVLMACA